MQTTLGQRGCVISTFPFIVLLFSMAELEKNEHGDAENGFPMPTIFQGL